MESRIWHNAYDEDVPQDIAFEKTILPDLLDLAAARFPGSPAIHFMNRTLVYAELHDQVQRFATALSRLGVGPGSKVAVHLPNLPQTVIAASAVFRLGAQTVMTNPLYVDREIEHQWTDAGCEVAVTADFLLRACPQEPSRDAAGPQLHHRLDSGISALPAEAAGAAEAEEGRSSPVCQGGTGRRYPFLLGADRRYPGRTARGEHRFPGPGHAAVHRRHHGRGQGRHADARQPVRAMCSRSLPGSRRRSRARR